MSLTTIKMRGVSVEGMLRFLKLADISGYVDKILNKGQILDVTKASLISKGHPMDKTFVKYKREKLGGIMTLEKPPQDFSLMKLPLYSISKVMDVMEIYRSSGSTEVEWDAECQKDDSGAYVAKAIRLSNGKIKVKLAAAEVYVTPYMEQTLWDRLSSVKSYIAKFSADDKFIKSLVDVNKINPDLTKTKKVPATVLSVTKDSLEFSSKKPGDWSVVVDESEVLDGGKLELVVPLRAMEMTKGGKYDTYLLFSEAFNQYLLISKNGEDDVIVNALLKQDNAV